MYLHYATAVGDFERVVEHWVMEEEWSKAIDVINRQVRRLSANPTFLTICPSRILTCITDLRPCLCDTRRKRQWIHGCGNER